MSLTASTSFHHPVPKRIPINFQEGHQPNVFHQLSAKGLQRESKSCKSKVKRKKLTKWNRHSQRQLFQGINQTTQLMCQLIQRLSIPEGVGMMERTYLWMRRSQECMVMQTQRVNRHQVCIIRSKR